MATARRLLIVWHSRTGLASQMAGHLEGGAVSTASEMGGELIVTRRRAAEATAEDLLSSDGYLFCAPENLASTSGEMLEFFHRTYYSAFTTDHDTGSEASVLSGRPYGVAVAAGSDGTGAARQMARICRGWRLRPVADPLIQRNGQPQTAEAIQQPKSCPPEAALRCAELGGLVAATLLL